jgi:phosphinothricin acetyltransferase
VTAARDGVALRDVVQGDAAAIAAIYGEHVLQGTASFELTPPGEEEMRRRMSAIVEDGYPWIVACDALGVAGFAYAGPYRPRPAYRYTVEDSVYLAPRVQRQGVGSALLRALIDRCTARGHRQMVAVIGDSANAASIALHARAGFVDAGRFSNVGWKFERWLDVVLMQRALGDGAASTAGALLS